MYFMKSILQTILIKHVKRFIGNLLASQEGEGGKALNYLVDSVEPKVLNDTEHSQTLKLIGDLSMQEEKYTDAINGITSGWNLPVKKMLMCTLAWHRRTLSLSS